MACLGEFLSHRFLLKQTLRWPLFLRFGRRAATVGSWPMAALPITTTAVIPTPGNRAWRISPRRDNSSRLTLRLRDRVAFLRPQRTRLPRRRDGIVVRPEVHVAAVLAALTIAAEGSKADIAKPLKGLGSGVMEIALPYRGNAFRVVYAVQLGEDVWVVHAFQKKSTQGIKTPKHEIDLISARVKRLKEMLR